MAEYDEIIKNSSGLFSALRSLILHQREVLSNLTNMYSAVRKSISNLVVTGWNSSQNAYAMQLIRIYYAGGRPGKKKPAKPRSVAGQRKRPPEQTYEQYTENEPEIEQITSPETSQTELYPNELPASEPTTKHWRDLQPVNYVHGLLKLGAQTAPLPHVALKQIPSSHLTNLLGKGVQAASFSPQTKKMGVVAYEKGSLSRLPGVAIRGKPAKMSAPARKTRQPYRQDTENLKSGAELAESDYRPELHPAIPESRRDNLQAVEDKQEQSPSEVSRYYVPESHASPTFSAISALEKITALQMIALSPAVSAAIMLSHVNALSEKPSIFRPSAQATSRKIDFAPNHLIESQKVRYPDEKSNRLPSVTETADLGSERAEATRISLPDLSSSYEKDRDSWSPLASVGRAYPTIVRSGLEQISGNRENDLSFDTQTISGLESEPPHANLPSQHSTPLVALIGNAVPSHSLLPVHSYLLGQRRTENRPSQLHQRSLDYTMRPLMMAVSGPLNIVNRIGEQASVQDIGQVPRAAPIVGEKAQKSKAELANIDDSVKPAGAAADTHGGLAPITNFRQLLSGGPAVGRAVSFSHMLSGFTYAAYNVPLQNYLRSAAFDLPLQTGAKTTPANEKGSMFLKNTIEDNYLPLTDNQIKTSATGIVNLVPYLMSSVSDNKILGLAPSSIDSIPRTVAGTIDTQTRRALHRINSIPHAEAIRNDETGEIFPITSSAVLDKSPGLADDKKEEFTRSEKSDQHIEKSLMQENIKDSIGGMVQKDAEIHHPGYVWPSSLLYQLTNVAGSFSREPNTQILEMIKSLPVNAYSIPSMIFVQPERAEAEREQSSIPDMMGFIPGVPAESLKSISSSIPSMARFTPMATHRTGAKSPTVRNTAQDELDLTHIYELQNTLAASARPATSLPANIFLEKYAMTGAPRGIQQKRSRVSKSLNSFKNETLHHNLPETSNYESVLNINNDYNPDRLDEFPFEESKTENKESESRELKRKIEEIINEEFRKYGFQL